MAVNYRKREFSDTNFEIIQHFNQMLQYLSLYELQFHPYSLIRCRMGGQKDYCYSAHLVLQDH